MCRSVCDLQVQGLNHEERTPYTAREALFLSYYQSCSGLVSLWIVTLFHKD